MALRTGYGTGTFTAGKFGLPQVYESSVSASIASSATSAAQRIHVGSSSASVLASTTTVGVRIQNGAASDSISTSVSGIGYTAIVGAVSDQIATGFDLYWNRVRPFSAQDNVNISVSINSRYKWLDSPDPVTTWAVADYLERAA